MTHERHQAALQALYDCLAACEHCASSCLAEQDVQMLAECIRLDRDCADVCALTARYLARDSRFTGPLAQLCAQTCDACGAECRKHADMHDHCRACMEACERCAQACRQLAA